MKQSLEKRIILFSFAILFLTILANSAMEIAVFRKEYRSELILRTQTLGSSFKSTIEKVLALGIEIKDISGLDEKCRELIQSSPETSYCTISDQTGATLVTSDTDFTAKLLADGRRIGGFPPNTHLIRTPHGNYIDVQTALVSFDSRQVATLHIGFPVDAINQKIYPILLRSLLIFTLFFTASFAMVVFFVKKSIVAPISQLLEGITSISEGNFSTNISPLPLLELDQLGNKINEMALILKNREQELHNNYEELAATHSQLHNSFLKLETLSSELEKSEELYKTLQEEAGDSIIILDELQQIIITNKMSERFLDIPTDQIIGQHISNILVKLGASEIADILAHISDAYNGSIVDDEILFNSSTGEQRSGRIHASRVIMGEKKLVQIIIRDTTKEREILINLENSAAGLARLNRMKDSFLGLASHELKTPLTVIMGYSELLLNDQRTSLNNLATEMIQHISNASSRLDGIIRDMIDVSMIDQKQLGLKLVPIQINTLIEFSLKELQFFFIQRNQSVVTRFATDTPIIKGDQTRLLQLFSNIIGNAIKFTPDGGTITVTTALKPLLPSNETVTTTPNSASFIEITISDTGIGIDREDQQRIFDKFYEAGNIEEHSSGKVAFKSRGAGLGLSIAKGIVEMHGGLLRVESSGYNPETFPGSSFIILLPLDQGLTDGIL